MIQPLLQLHLVVLFKQDSLVAVVAVVDLTPIKKQIVQPLEEEVVVVLVFLLEKVVQLVQEVLKELMVGQVKMLTK